MNYTIINKNNEGFIIPMRNWNMIPSYQALKGICGFIIPMRNWNYKDRKSCQQLDIRIYNTYEELKHKITRYSPFRFHWIYNTYEELKLSISSLVRIFPSGFIIPMRNWNRMIKSISGSSLRWIYNTYEELKLKLNATKWEDIPGIYNTYEELKLDYFCVSHCLLPRIYNTYEELKLSLFLAPLLIFLDL